MRAFLLLLALAVFVSTCVKSLDLELDADGNSLNQQEQGSDSVYVVVENTYAREIELYWQDTHSDDVVFMFNIAARESAKLNTFKGHRFFAKDIGSDTRLADKINIKPAVKFYYIGPNASKSKGIKLQPKDGITPQLGLTKGGNQRVLGSPLKIIGSKTTAMAAKFKCHCTAVDYYYDDGGAGVFQGSLSLGKETTINTYEGHVFYFTQKNKKENVLARYLMVVDKVNFLQLSLFR